MAEKVPIATRLRVRVNPEYDHEVDPEENEVAYVNPVALNNDLVRLGNEMPVLAEARVNALRSISKLRLSKRKVERQLEDLEEELLRDDPLSSTEAKSLKTISAAVALRVKKVGNTTHPELRKQIRVFEDQIDEQESIAKSAQLYWETAEKICENIKTHLSYVKDEKRRSGYGT